MVGGIGSSCKKSSIRRCCLDIESGEYFALNDVGKKVWTMCDGTRTVAQVADAVYAEYDVAPDTAFDDTDALLENLVGAGLVIEA